MNTITPSLAEKLRDIVTHCDEFLLMGHEADREVLHILLRDKKVREWLASFEVSEK
jgi:hypothetical protein